MIRVCIAKQPAKPGGSAPSLVKPDGAALLAEAVKKLRLKKKEVAAVRLFIWSKDERGGTELPRDADLRSLLRNDDFVVVSLGEDYQGPTSFNPGGLSIAATATESEPAAVAGHAAVCWLRWESRPQTTGSLALVEWSDAKTMNATLGRMSTLLEHPTLCGLATGRLVPHSTQRGLPSSKYLGHNLYAQTLLEFERLAAAEAPASPLAPAPASSLSSGQLPSAREGECGDSIDSVNATSASGSGGGASSSCRTGASHPSVGPSDLDLSAAERGFLTLWRARGCPEVVISFVAGEAATLAHELCHARFALDAPYREALCAAWEGDWRGRLHKWMASLGYHPSRHADEFGAYLLTENAAFWRGRVPPEDVRALRAQLVPPSPSPQPPPPPPPPPPSPPSRGQAEPPPPSACVAELASDIQVACDISDEGASERARATSAAPAGSTSREALWAPGGLELAEGVPRLDVASWMVQECT